MRSVRADPEHRLMESIRRMIASRKPVELSGPHPEKPGDAKPGVSKDGRGDGRASSSPSRRKPSSYGRGLLLRMRSESLETIGFMESIHEQALDERSNIRKLFSRCLLSRTPHSLVLATCCSCSSFVAGERERVSEAVRHVNRDDALPMPEKARSHPRCDPGRSHPESAATPAGRTGRSRARRERRCCRGSRPTAVRSPSC